MEPTQAGYRGQLPIDLTPNKLRIFNSLTRNKDTFVLNESNLIKWYSCGPTVYDSAHLGHARSYMTFDIIRRILADYFGYQVSYVMNITDIDDKIIKRARSEFLCDQFMKKFIKEADKRELLLSEIKDSIQNYQVRRLDEKEHAKLSMINNIMSSSNQALERLVKVVSQPDQSEEELMLLLEKLREVIRDEQDTKLAHTVSDHKIFKRLATKYENEFNQDMNDLGILPPTYLERVSDHINEIGEFIAKIESNGFAYRVDGSVYFDTQKFDDDPKHSYAKLVRQAYGKNKELDEGEGELSHTRPEAKHSPNDFALWKKSKPGEPFWVTLDYQAGRPGWHIECSAMASHKLGSTIDIHSGGCDLKFPHHDNEIAQAEAYYNTGMDWVKYFIHSGHLTISGCKMSKSLKNFITIRQALQDYTPAEIRFLFLAHSWTDTLDYSPDTMKIAINYHETFEEFLYSAAASLRHKKKHSVDRSEWTDEDRQLNQEFQRVIGAVDELICDNFNTRSALDSLCALVREYNKKKDVNASLLFDISQYVLRILKVFGIEFDERRINQENSESMCLLADFRAQIRKLCMENDPRKSVVDILALCDEMRDLTLPTLGVQLKDQEVDDRPYVMRLVDPRTLAIRKARAARRVEDKLELHRQREEKAKVPASEMFKGQTDKYSRFDHQGIPTHDKDGNEITKSAHKKLMRAYLEQEARYNKYRSRHQ